MAVGSIIKKILKRPFFHGQDRIFNYFFTRNKLNVGHQVVKPLIGNFQIDCDTKTWIGAKIAFIGDYEAELKSIIRSYIKPGNCIVDIGANIGFHTLYFAELVGEKGKVISFEPVPCNFSSLNHNISLNQFENIEVHNLALADKEEEFSIEVDQESTNPGSFSLLNKGGNTVIKCLKGDHVLKDGPVDLIKIDVEGYEAYVIAGLLKTIEKERPILIFEYDINHIHKTELSKNYIFEILNPFDYSFFEITRDGLKPFSINKIQSCNVLAKPKNINL